MKKSSVSIEGTSIKSVKKTKKRSGIREGTWNASQIQNRISEIEEELTKGAASEDGGSGSVSKARKKLLLTKIARLRKALKGEIEVGGQLAKRVKPRPHSQRRVKERTTLSKSQWKKNRRIECLCCRKRGHTWQECKYKPETTSTFTNTEENTEPTSDSHSDASKLNQNSSPTSSQRNVKFGDAAPQVLCFNCGKTTHTLKNCPLPRSLDSTLPFAVCFVCGEKGHLAQKCSQNSNGIYPRGGGCHICNSLFHLMRDCPDRRNAHARSRNNPSDKADQKRNTSGSDTTARKYPSKSHNDAAGTVACSPEESNDDYWTQ